MLVQVTAIRTATATGFGATDIAFGCGAATDIAMVTAITD